MEQLLLGPGFSFVRASCKTECWMNIDDLDSLKENLPTVPGIMGKDRLINSAVLIPFVDVDGEYHLLFQKRAKAIRQGGEVCFPGGLHDGNVDTDLRDTAIRETVEELGISKDRIQIIGIQDTLIAPMGVTVDSFIGVLDIDFPGDLSLNKSEVEDVFLLPLSFFEKNAPEKYSVRLEVKPSYVDRHNREKILLPADKLGLPERYKKPWGGRHHRVLVWNTAHGVIWGLTAELVYQLVNYPGLKAGACKSSR